MKRHTAKKCKVEYLLGGRFVQREGWEPSYFETVIGKLHRVSLAGVVVAKEESSLIVDDGSGKLVVRSFEKPFEDLSIGDPVIVIGKPRLFNNEPYVAAEIVKKTSKEWLKVWRLEAEATPKQELGGEEEVEEALVDEGNLAELIMERVKRLDKGEGARVEEVLKGLNDADPVLRSLLEQGEVYEVRPGLVKLLE